MALLDDIATALQTAGIGTINATSGWAIFKSFMPDSPDTVVIVDETGGDVPETEWALDRPTFQVRVRGSEFGYEDARSKMQDVFDNLHAKESDIGSTYTFVYAIQSAPIPLGYDESHRPSMVLNFRVMKQR